MRRLLLTTPNRLTRYLGTRYTPARKRVVTVTLREARQRAGLTQMQLVKRAGISQPALSDYELGRRTPRLRTARRIEAALGLPPGSIDWLGLDPDSGTERPAAGE